MVDPRIVRSRAAVVEAARHLVLEQGAAAVTIEAVIQRSGVARSTIYRNFRTSEDVLLAAVDSMMPPTVEVARDRAAAAGDRQHSTRQDIREDVLVLLQQLAFSVQHAPWGQALPSLLELLARTPGLERVQQHLLDHHRQPMRQVLNQARRGGVLPPDTDVELLASMLVGPLFYRHFISGEPVGDVECIALVNALLPSRDIPNEAGHDAVDHSS